MWTEARMVALCLLWVVIVILPFGIANPFFAMEFESPPSPTELLWLWIMPWWIVCAMSIVVLRRHRAAFTPVVGKRSE
jgi:hypothetical protein